MTRVAIVGAGFAGVGMAATLLRDGVEDLVVLEKGPTAGGVWRENRYPGAAVDVPSDLYSFSFERRYPFARRYGEQRELLAYLLHCADKYGVTPRLRCNAEVTRATWQDPGWRLELAGGETLEADVVIAACGALSVPQPPQIPGVGSFDGPAFHSAHWPEDFEVAGQRIAVVGTGASAIQIVPAIAGAAARVDVYQRTPPWIGPKTDKDDFAGRPRALEAAGRLYAWLFFESFTSGFTGRGWALMPLRAYARAHLRRQVRDPELRRRVTPDYPVGCKRLLVSSDWYPALARDDVKLITDPIETITPLGIRAGAERAYDAIVYATGFRTGGFVAPMEVVGAGGRSLAADAWATGAEAYLGISVAGFPNLFLLYGPNTNLGSGSIVYMLECQMRYVADALRRLRDEGLAWVDVRDAVHRAFADEMQERLEDSVWMQCDSWYRVEGGRVTTNWPGSMTEYRRRTARLRPAAYRARSATAPAAPRR